MDMISASLHVINILLASILLIIYLQNYRKMKSKYTIGLILFASVFLLHSLMGLYFDAAMVMFSSKSAEHAALVLEGIKAVSFAVLLWISWE